MVFRHQFQFHTQERHLGLDLVADLAGLVAEATAVYLHGVTLAH
jgi:hypothetical protein